MDPCLCVCVCVRELNTFVCHTPEGAQPTWAYRTLLTFHTETREKGKQAQYKVTRPHAPEEVHSLSDVDTQHVR